MEIPSQLLLLLPLAVAAGLQLYLTLLLLGVALYLGVPIQGAEVVLPPEALPGLAALACLYLAEVAAELDPRTALGWHNLQLFVRPFGAGLLGIASLPAQPLPFLALGAAMAGTVAAFSHVVAWGRSLILRLVPGKRLPPLALRAMADLGCVALLLLTLRSPTAGVLVGTTLLVLGLLFGGASHGATRFGWALMVDWAWGIVSPTSWVPLAELPRWARMSVGADPPRGLRGARAATWGLVGPRAFRGGWILQTNQALLFVFRKWRGAGVVPIPLQEMAIRQGPLWKALVSGPENEPSAALFLQKGLIGPESHK